MGRRPFKAAVHARIGAAASGPKTAAPAGVLGIAMNPKASKPSHPLARPRGQ
ncbi:MAG: hypothetical protein QF464_02480 [Myxococcota bacterium]|nr:hypothetical protein [Myxococcota bacterium]